MAHSLSGLMADWPWVLALALAFLAGTEFQRRTYWWFKRKRPAKRRFQTANLKGVRPVEKTVQFDPAQQLREVELAEFAPRKLLNKREARLFTLLERVVAQEAPQWRVMAQVSLGEILSSPSEAAYRAINSKRVDLLIIDNHGHPLHAVEYQGSGHHLGPAATRDAVKREALRKAGIGFIEVKVGDTPTEVRQWVSKLAPKNGHQPSAARFNNKGAGFPTPSLVSHTAEDQP